MRKESSKQKGSGPKEAVPVDLPPASVSLAPIPGTIQALIGRADSIIQEARGMVVSSHQGYELADEVAVSLTKEASVIDEFRKGLTRPLDALKAQWIAIFKPSIEARLEAAKIIRTSMQGFERAERERQAEEQRIADELTRKAREAEEKKARQAREEEERLRQEAEQKRREAERAGAARKAQLEEEARKLEQKAEKKGSLAEQREETARHTVGVVVPSREPQTSASNKKKTWKARILDPMAVVKAIAEGRAPITLIQVLQPKANDLAKIYKDTSSIPGLEFYEDEDFAAKPGARS